MLVAGVSVFFAGNISDITYSLSMNLFVNNAGVGVFLCVLAMFWLCHRHCQLRVFIPVSDLPAIL